MMLVTLRQACDMHQLSYSVFKARVSRLKIKPVEYNNGKSSLFNYADLAPHLYPVIDNQQAKARCKETMRRNKYGMNLLDKPIDSNALTDKWCFKAQTEQSNAMRVIASLSIYE
jgi:hypothetical protein